MIKRKLRKNEAKYLNPEQIYHCVSIKEAIRSHLKFLMDIRLVPKEGKEVKKCKSV